MPLTRRTLAASLSLWLVAACPLAQAGTPLGTPLDLAYNPANTGPSYLWQLNAVRVSADGRKLQVRTQPTAQLAGGIINLGSYPWWITLVSYDHGVGWTRNGDRWRGSGALPAPTHLWATVAVLQPGSSHVYRVLPMATAGIVRGQPGASWTGTVQGTLTTDGTRGALDASHLIDFDLHIIGEQN